MADPKKPGTMEDYANWLSAQPKRPSGEGKTQEEKNREEKWRRELEGSKEAYVAGKRPLETAFERDEEPDRKKGLPVGHLEKTSLSREKMLEGLDFLESFQGEIKEWISGNKINSYEDLDISEQIIKLNKELNTNPTLDNET